MLFNSYGFIFGFLPVVLAGFCLLGQHRREWALLWLTGASLLFYAAWRPLNVVLIAPSIFINFALAWVMERIRHDRTRLARGILIGGILFNVCFLGYFKYLTFAQQAMNDIFGAGFILTEITMPLGLSFITFQKIAFLVDVHAGRVSRVAFPEYTLFVTFFPQLIAGPIVHYREMMPQFQAASCRYNPENAAVGLTLFFFGLAKKLVLADPLGQIVAPLYANAAAGVPQTLIEAWIAALGFTLQIYFDFSGYCDMALGLARLFGIKLPVNFNSPLKATSIIDFWGRWHITLTRFLTAYLYMPMTFALTRRRVAQGKPIRGGAGLGLPAFCTLLALPTILTMLASGLWHGAGYTFIIWGLLHGMLLVVNHGWRIIRPRIWKNTAAYNRVAAPLGWLLTFVSVVFTMAMFRAASAGTAVMLWKGMCGFHGATLPQVIMSRMGAFGGWLRWIGFQPAWTSGSLLLTATSHIAVLLFVALAMPNTLELLAAYEPALGVKPAKARGWLLRWAAWHPNRTWAAGVACVAMAGILSLGGLHAFIYWQF